MLRQADEFVLLNELIEARRRTDALFDLIPDAMFYERPIRERHRVVFYLGHLEAFDANLILRKSSLRNSDGPVWRIAARQTTRNQRMRELNQLFAFGIDPVATQLPKDTRDEWPALEEIRDYVRKTRRQVVRHVSRNVGRRIDTVPIATLLHAAIEHRLMHAETLVYLLNRVSFDKPSRLVAPTEREFSNDDMVTIPGGATTLGAYQDEHAFVWDNEREPHRIEVPSFDIDRYMVTNGQFLRFVEDGGYTHRRWWRDADWQWREAHNVLHPAAWCVVEGEWYWNSLYDRVPMQSDWPVYVSQAEAQAYANWCGKELPSEAQWQRAAYGSPDRIEWPYPWGTEAPARQHGNFDFMQWDPQPVDAHPQGRSSFGVAGLLGNGWEWTSTLFAPFAGFERYEFYRGYSADFFDGKHFVLKGGSMHTAARLLRHSFRNWFQPHYPYLCAGFRCVRN